ncbi:PseG/SpsG family protein [Hymenobacter tenuis]
MSIFFRADGNGTIGLGHVIRSLALAEIAGANRQSFFIASNPPEVVRDLVHTAGLELIELTDYHLLEEANYLCERFFTAKDIVVLDGYLFNQSYQLQLKRSGCQLICIDDLCKGSFVADLIINHSPGITSSMYNALETTRYCLGPAFSLVRSPFRQRFHLPHPIKNINKVLLCFGGADPMQLSIRCLEALLPVEEIKYIGVIMGGASEPLTKIELLRSQYTSTIIKELRGLSAEAMAEEIELYDAIICPASTILIESLILGKACITGYYVDNQRRLADYVGEHNHAYSIGDYEELTDFELNKSLNRALRWLSHTSRVPYVREILTTKLCEEVQAMQARN